VKPLFIQIRTFCPLITFSAECGQFWQYKQSIRKQYAAAAAVVQYKQQASVMLGVRPSGAHPLVLERTTGPGDVTTFSRRSVADDPGCIVRVNHGRVEETDHHHIRGRLLLQQRPSRARALHDGGGGEQQHGAEEKLPPSCGRHVYVTVFSDSDQFFMESTLELTVCSM
jgi:hypothetical protein